MKLHYAFQVTPDDVLASVAALRHVGLEPAAGGGRPIDEPEPPQPPMQRLMLSEWRRLHATNLPA
jgi:hypothetical protein